MADFIQNGGKNGGNYASHFSCRLSVWENSYDINSNTSNVGYRLQLISGSSGRFSGLTASYSVNINGTTVKSGSGTYNSQNYNTAQTICEGTTTIAHNSDGSKTISCSAILDFQSHTYSPGDFTPSGNLTLTKIPRYAEINSAYVESVTLTTATIRYSVSRKANIYCSIDKAVWGGAIVSNTTSGTFTITGLSPNTKHSFSILARSTESGLDKVSNEFYGTTKDIAKISAAPNVNIGNSHTITWSNPSGANISLKLCKTDNTQIINFGTVTGTSKTVTPTASTIYALTPNSNNITLRYIITTTENNTSYTNYKDCIFTVTNSSPTFSNFTYQDTNATTLVLTGNNQILIKGYSNVKGTISASNKAIAKNSATMKNYKLLIGSKSTTANYNNTLDVNMSISTIDSNVIDMYAIDSRENSTKLSKTAEIKNYSKIKIISLTATRENNVGQAVTLKFEGQFWNDNFGSVSNSIKSCIYKYKNTTSSTYINGETTLTYTISGNKITGNIIIKGDLGANGFNVSNSYNIQLTLADELSSANYTITLGSGNPAIAIYKNNVAIGQNYDTSNESKLQVNGKSLFKNDVNMIRNDGSTDAFYYSKRSDTDTEVAFGVGVGGTNHGVYSRKIKKWLIHSDGSKVYVNNCAIDGIKSASSKTHTNYNTNQSYIPTMSFLTYWNGAYNGSNSSNLTYCHQGEIQAKPKSLYDNSSGTTGSITLSETATNFAYLEIFYFKDASSGYWSHRIYNPNGRNINASMQYNYGDGVQITALRYAISGTSITRATERYINISGTSIGNAGTQTSIKIIKVVGYK